MGLVQKMRTRLLKSLETKVNDIGFIVLDRMNFGISRLNRV